MHFKIFNPEDFPEDHPNKSVLRITSTDGHGNQSICFIENPDSREGIEHIFAYGVHLRQTGQFVLYNSYFNLN